MEGALVMGCHVHDNGTGCHASDQERHFGPKCEAGRQKDERKGLDLKGLAAGDTSSQKGSGHADDSAQKQCAADLGENGNFVNMAVSRCRKAKAKTERDETPCIINRDDAFKCAREFVRDAGLANNICGCSGRRCRGDRRQDDCQFGIDPQEDQPHRHNQQCRQND